MMVINESNVTKGLFSRYVRIQLEGKYNMIMDSNQVIQLLDCDETTYFDILNNYGKYSKLYQKTIDNVATNIQEKARNLLTSKTEVIGHQTNCKGITGGLAGDIFKQFPECYKPYLHICLAGELSKQYSECYKSYLQHYKVNNPLGKTQLLKMDDGRFLANIFGQNEAGAATDYKMVLSALENLKEQMDSLGLKSLSLPYKMGAGIGGGDWNEIFGLIEEVFGHTMIKVILCKLEK